MNKIYRLKFSKRLNQLVAVSEITAGHDRHSGCQNAVDTVSSFQMTKWLKLKPLASLISLLSFGFATQTAMANGLQGMEVVSGSASMSINGKNTTITNSPDAIINWKQFNINQDELVRFVQENSNSAVFNRVTSDQISQLKGALNSNGHVFLINPNGIVMGKDAVINAAGFTASTLNISDKDLKARNFNFEQAKDKAMAQIVNNGLISVSKNGSVNLIGGSVKNNGVIKVEDGNILLLAGQKVTISDITNPTITYSVVAPKNEAVNLGTIFAKNGKIQIHAGSVVNKGALNANSVRKDKSGAIILSAKEGEANIDGTVTLNNANFKAGSLTITGKKVVLNSGAKVELTGKQGGTVYIGGDERGQGKIQLAEKTEIKQGASVNVSGSEKGGKAIVWGDRAQVDGEIIAKGKDKKNSGFVETSGHYLA
ncbi:filamentous hemagglutinin N-terminal domain-containing protein [Haemophilus influenzae]